MDRKKINKEIKQYIVRLKQKLEVDRVILFGSFARREATVWSDIDLLVVADFKKMDMEKRFNLLYDLHDDLIKEHDINAYGLSSREFEAIKPWSILADAKKEGILLYRKKAL